MPLREIHTRLRTRTNAANLAASWFSSSSDNNDLVDKIANRQIDPFENKLSCNDRNGKLTTLLF